MRIQPRDLWKTPKGAVETRFSRVINQYDAYVNKLVNDVRTWRMVGLCAVLMVVCTLIGWFYILSIRQIVPVVIEVNEFGKARYLGDLNKGSYLRGYVVKDYMIESVLREFLDLWRAIYVDTELMAKNYQEAMDWCGNELKERWRNELIEDDPMSLVGSVTRRVMIESGIKITENSWQYDWYEVTFDLYGNEIERERYRGLLTVGVKEPETENERFKNPLGVYVIDYHISTINEVMR